MFNLQNFSIQFFFLNQITAGSHYCCIAHNSLIWSRSAAQCEVEVEKSMHKAENKYRINKPFGDLN